MSIVTRPATPADFSNLGIDLPARVRALALECDGQTLAILGGIMDMPDGITAAFLSVGETPPKRFGLSLHRAAHALIDEARRLGFRRIAAEAEPGNEAAERWIRRFGFAPIETDGRTIWLLSL